MKPKKKTKKTKPFPIKNFGKGAIIKPTKIRDYRLETAGAVILPSQFSVADKLGLVKNQNGSGSCVGQAFSYYAEVLNTIETGLKTALSARDIYSLIFQPEGGAYLADAAIKLCKTGVVTEVSATSYEAGKPPTEAFMRSRSDITQEEQNEGMSYLAKSYVTWDRYDVELYKQAIFQGSGCVVACKGNNNGWTTSPVVQPSNEDQVKWQHAIYLVGYDDKTRLFTFINSWGNKWGDGGFGKLPYSYISSGYVSNPFTLIDLPNTTYVSMLSILKNLLEKLIALLKGRQ